MKSFSIKALALAFVVVVGSANAGITDTVKKYATSAKNGVVNALNKADNKVFGTWEPIVGMFTNADDVANIGSVKGGFRPFSTFNRYSRNKLAHAAVVVAATAAITAAVVKTYKHFTKPAADATEGENVEANEATTVA